MGDGASSSRSSTEGRGEGRERGGNGETVVIDYGRRRTSCGYCRSTSKSSFAHGLWANSITAEDYQDCLCRRKARLLMRQIVSDVPHLHRG